jgi:hypothetical protein
VKSGEDVATKVARGSIKDEDGQDNESTKNETMPLYSEYPGVE